MWRYIGCAIMLLRASLCKYNVFKMVHRNCALMYLQRPVSVKIEAQDIKGKKFDIHLKGFQARIFQHEYDHLQVSNYILVCS